MTSADLQLRADAISKRYARTLFSGISCDLHAGDSLALTGENGSGKSTLLKILSMIAAPSRGTVSASIDGIEPNMKTFRRITGVLLPDAAPHAELTLEEHLGFVLQGQSRSHAEALITRLQLGSLRHLRAERYSSGETQRAKILFALCRDPRFLFLDEPSSFLDESGTRTLFELLEEMRTRTVIVVATNDPRERSFCGGEVRLGGRS